MKPAFSSDEDMALYRDFYFPFWGAVASVTVSPVRAKGAQGIVRSQTSTRFLSKFVVMDSKEYLDDARKIAILYQWPVG